MRKNIPCNEKMQRSIFHTLGKLFTLWDYAQKHNIVIEGLDKPVADISEHEEEEEY